MGCIESRYDFKYLSGKNLEYIKAKTGYDETTIKQSHKIFIMECPNGRLTPDKFIDLYNLFVWRGNGEQYCEHVFRTFDTDQNGCIDFEEFLLAMYITSAGSAEEKLTWAFRMYDVDGNGTIEPDEMGKVVEAIYGMLCQDATEPTTSAKKKAMKEKRSKAGKAAKAKRNAGYHALQDGLKASFQKAQDVLDAEATTLCVGDPLHGE